ncbi:hypothetical protein [Chitinophaga oryzae]|uniref:hypothetical protein n=1 Tax=Chitinophaga oryzae TaxID=2725414 RepID=UPI001C65B785|nr:hypothetical protein [Chitinophaga oryzae]
MHSNITIAIDFDGTCAYHRFPMIGEEIPHCITVLQRLQQQGVKLILNTMRSGRHLKDAVKWLNGKGITLYGENRNPQQRRWTGSPKVQADFYIDDAALGCPVEEDIFGRVSVDWYKMETLLEARQVLPARNRAKEKVWLLQPAK